MCAETYISGKTIYNWFSVMAKITCKSKRYLDVVDRRGLYNYTPTEQKVDVYTYVDAGYIAINQTLHSQALIVAGALTHILTGYGSHWTCVAFSFCINATQLQIRTKIYMKIINCSIILLRCVTIHYPSIEQLKYTNCTVSIKEICFHRHHQTCLTHHFDQHQMTL